MAYKIIKPDEIPHFEHPFGWVFELSNRNHSSALNMARIQIRDDKKHYHKKATEIYYIFAGKGTIELNDKTFEIAQNYVIIIDPLTKHKAKAKEGQTLDIIVASSPPYNPEDEFFD